jgi:hypothetical protein
MVVICLVECACRYSDDIELPCDWMSDGFCGADARKCDVKAVCKGS